MERADKAEDGREQHEGGNVAMGPQRSPALTRTQWVYEHLKEAILSGAMKPGERLVVDPLARDFGTSPIPVREALRRLEAEGLIENTPYIGARVAPFREEELAELMAIRRELEPLLARTAAETVTESVIEQLEVLVGQMDDASDPMEYSRLNYQFHRLLYQQSPWKVTMRIVDMVWELSARTRFVFTQAPEAMERSQTEHRAMVQALRNRDAESLERLTRLQKERAFALFSRQFKRRRERLAECTGVEGGR